MKRHRPNVLALSLLALLALAIIAAIELTKSTRPAPKPVGGLRDATVLPAGLTNSPAPTIRLRDARGGTFNTHSLRGTPYAVTFLYTSCPDVCPLIGEELQTALSRLGADARQVSVLAVSVDPRGDTQANVRSWLALHREPTNFHYLIGSEQALKPTWDAYFVAPQIPGDPNSSHTAAIWLVDRQGRRVAEINAGVPVTPANLDYDFRALLREP
ncbi:MAG TPA: SCO family protein [Solirubrobacteraceae bacterium]